MMNKEKKVRYYIEEEGVSRNGQALQQGGFYELSQVEAEGLGEKVSRVNLPTIENFSNEADALVNSFKKKAEQIEEDEKFPDPKAKQALLKEAKAELEADMIALAQRRQEAIEAMRAELIRATLTQPKLSNEQAAQVAQVVQEAETRLAFASTPAQKKEALMLLSAQVNALETDARANVSSHLAKLLTHVEGDKGARGVLMSVYERSEKANVAKTSARRRLKHLDALAKEDHAHSYRLLKIMHSAYK